MEKGIILYKIYCKYLMEAVSRRKIVLAWLWVALCSTAIFLTVPVARSIQKFVYNNWGREVFGYFVLVVLGIGFLGLLYFLSFKLKIRHASNYFWLFIVAGLYLYFTLKLWKIPEEAVHFLEYGLLGFFLFKALTHNVKDKSIYFTATLFALLIGTFDEILQWITPQRFWDFRDAGLNGLSGGLFQLAVWKVVKPVVISEKVNPESIKILSSISALCLIFLGLCASNTPERVAYYTRLIPALSFLQKEESMSEFGYKYKDPEIGVFYSRLSLKSLQKEDKVKGEKYAQILNESVNKDYDQFLKEYNPITHPFMHELRVHLFRRDSYFEKGNISSNIDEKRESYFIAYKENLILKKYFTQSIQKSVYRWSEDKIQKGANLIDKNKFYESPVSAGLFTKFSEKTMWIVILVLISTLIFFNLAYSSISKKTGSESGSGLNI
ncbi:MAG: VanZ family protein [Acidobacteriota bacterium]